MTIEHAKEILKALADGTNPVTGEILAKEDSCNQPDVIRALYTAVEHLNLSEQKSKNRNPNLPENAGKPWTEQEEELLCDMFRNGNSIREIADYFKRTRGSISSRLEKFGLITRYQE